MIGKTEVTYASCTAFLQQKIQHSVVDVAGMKRGHSVIAHTHTVQQQIVEVVCLQFLERITVHGDRCIAAPGGGREVRQFRGYEIMVAGMACESCSCGTFRTSLTIGGGGIEIVHAVCQCMVDQSIDCFLIHRLVTSGKGWPAHTAIAEGVWGKSFPPAGAGQSPARRRHFPFYSAWAVRLRMSSCTSRLSSTK